MIDQLDLPVESTVVRKIRIVFELIAYLIKQPLYNTNKKIVLSTEFLKYDTDDGRSSKIFQNEDDNSYYGELEKEFEQGIYFIHSIFPLPKTPQKTLFFLRIHQQIDEYLGRAEGKLGQAKTEHRDVASITIAAKRLVG